MKDGSGQSPLHFTALYGQPTVAQVLLNAKAVIDLPDNNSETPLHLAAKWGHIHVIRTLLNHVRKTR